VAVTDPHSYSVHWGRECDACPNVSELSVALGSLLRSHRRTLSDSCSSSLDWL